MCSSAQRFPPQKLAPRSAPESGPLSREGGLKSPRGPVRFAAEFWIFCKSACASGILEVAVYFKVLRPFSFFPALATGHLFTTGLGVRTAGHPKLLCVGFARLVLASEKDWQWGSIQRICRSGIIGYIFQNSDFRKLFSSAKCPKFGL